MEDRYGHQISYLRISITDRCNERCRYCMPEERQAWLPRSGILSYEEILRLVRVGITLGIRKLRITGGEPLVRRGVLGFMDILGALPEIQDLGISTNGTLLADADENGISYAQRLRAAGVRSVNISLDTLDSAAYATTTGRDYLAKVLLGIQAAKDAGIPKIKLNAVLIKGTSEAMLVPLVDFAAKNDLWLRFIELMPVSTQEVLTAENFLSVGVAKKLLEEALGTLTARPDLKGNGPAAYYQIPGREQCVGFIGAMTNLHFCENCNKLRLTADGKLRPCLGSHLEFDTLPALRGDASDADLAQIFRDVVARKPKEHDFRSNYQPNRRMIAIGG
jgi:cyclic pyranopterin phosphate synthase